MSKPSVAIYVRVSTSHQADRDSLPMQRDELINYCKFVLNTDDYAIFEDAGYSGKNTDRPAFQDMMSQCRKKTFTHILVWKIDRISRNLLDFANMYEELKKLNITFVSKNEQFDTSTAIGETMLKIILIFAELERKMTAERVTATMLSRASNGIWNGGKIPFGYSYDKSTKQFDILDKEASTVKRIYNLYAQGVSMAGIAKSLNAEGITTRKGIFWNPASVNVILKNPFYYGTYRYNWLNWSKSTSLKNTSRQNKRNEDEWILIDNHHPAIIDKALYDKCMRISNQANVRGAGNKPVESRTVHIFYRKLICSCGEVMTAHSGKVCKGGYQASNYLCPSKRKSETGCKSINDTLLGEFFFNYILKMMNAQNAVISTPQQLQDYLLCGASCDYIESIDRDGLYTFFNILKQGTSDKVFFKPSKAQKTTSIDKEINRLQKGLERQKRALERLKSLYLYADSSLSETEYITQSTEIAEKISELKQSLSLIKANHYTISDENFVRSASAFILKRTFADRNYANFKNLSINLDRRTLQEFVNAIVDSITIHKGLVKSISFRNGMVHTFKFKKAYK